MKYTAALLFHNTLSRCILVLSATLDDLPLPFSQQEISAPFVSVDQSSSELLSSSGSDRSAMGNLRSAATPLS